MADQRIVDMSHVEVRDEAFDRSPPPEKKVTGTDIPVQNTPLAKKLVCYCVSATLVHSPVEMRYTVPSTIA